MKYTKQEAYEVGKKQKEIVLLILVSIVAFFIPYSSFVVVIVGIIGIVFVYQLATAEKSSIPWLWAFLQIIPIVRLICLLILNQKATKILRSHNVRVGLMGGNSQDLEKLIQVEPISSTDG